MMPPHESGLSFIELFLYKLHLISPLSLWSILGSGVLLRIHGKVTAPCHNIYYLWLANRQKKKVAAFFWFILYHYIYFLKFKKNEHTVGDSLACEVDEGRRKQLCSQARGIGHRQYLYLKPVLIRLTWKITTLKLH